MMGERKVKLRVGELVRRTRGAQMKIPQDDDVDKETKKNGGWLARGGTVPEKRNML